MVAARQQEIQAEFQPSKERIKPASSGAKNVWDILPSKTEALLKKRQQQQMSASEWIDN